MEGLLFDSISSSSCSPYLLWLVVALFASVLFVEAKHLEALQRFGKCVLDFSLGKTAKMSKTMEKPGGFGQKWTFPLEKVQDFSDFHFFWTFSWKILENAQKASIAAGFWA